MAGEVRTSIKNLFKPAAFVIVFTMAGQEVLDTRQVLASG